MKSSALKAIFLILFTLSGTSCLAGLQGDTTGNCKVDFEDLGLMAQQWLQVGDGEVGLSSHWKFDTGSGNLAYNSINGNYAAIYGAQWVEGKFGSALNFTQAGSKINIPQIELISDYSISFWAKVSTASIAMVFGDDSTAESDYFYLFDSKGARFRNSDGDVVLWDGDVHFIGKWRFVTLVAGEDQIELFLDAIPQGKRQVDPHIYIKQIGAGDTTANYNFKGILDDFRIYDRKLSLEEIWSLRNRASSVAKRADLNNSETVDMKDFSVLARNWNNEIVQPLVISEFMASNEETFFDGDGDSPDWIEIFNTTGYDIELGGWYLTDNENNLTKWRFPFGTTIKANDYLIVCASEKGDWHYPYICPDGHYHADFLLSLEGEYLAIVKPDGEISFEYSGGYPVQMPDISYGLSPAMIESARFIKEGDPVRYIVPKNGSLGTSWTALGFDDSSWLSGTTGIGFDTSGIFASLIKTDIQTRMYNRQTSAYMRIQFKVENPQHMESLVLRMKYDDGFVAYLNGVEVARACVDVLNDETPEFNGSAIEHMDSEVFVFEEFDITSYRGLLHDGTNVLAIHGLNTDILNSNFVIVPELVAASLGVDAQRYVYFKEPTPGSDNNYGVAILGPELSQAAHSPIVPTGLQDIKVTVKVDELVNPVNPSSIQLHWRVMYGAESVCSMFDDGTRGDDCAGDGVYSGIIDSNNFAKNDMVRWYITASDNQGYSSRYPVFANPLSTAQYFGTIAKDPYLTCDLPILYWYTANTTAVDTRTGTRCSVFYNNEFYDNVFIRTRGGSSNGWTKKNHKIEFNREHYCLIDPDEIRVDEINLNSVYADTSYIRDLLSMETLQKIGCPASLCFPLRIHQNGQYHSMAMYIEQVDSKFLERNGYADDNPLYKSYCPYNDASLFEVKNGNYDPLIEFIEGLKLPIEERHYHIFDYMDIPQAVSYAVGNTICQEIDHTQKNFYTHYDVEKEQWACFPWDRDLSWGYLYTGSGDLYYMYGIYFGGWGGTTDNLYLQSVFLDPKAKEMYLRRLRTIMDEYLQQPGTPREDLIIEKRLDEYYNYVKAEADLDRSVWGYLNTGYVQYPHVSIRQSIRHIKDQYLALRRQYLYNVSGIPDAQPANPYVGFGTIEYNPASGDQGQEYIELVNSNDYAVDISGWKLTGGVEFTFEKSTVICSRDSIYISPDRVAFKNRAASPTGGQGHFVQGNYDGHLCNWGETIQLLDENGNLVSQGSYSADPTEAQRYLRITEIMYHPDDFNGIDGDEFEYIELQNTGTAVLSLNGVCFTNGIEYRFDMQDNITLGADEYIVIVKNRDAFASKYNISQINLAPGQYSANLSNSGEKIKIEDSTNSTILDFEYKDSWYKSTDGAGFSLTIRDAKNSDLASWGQKDNWRASAVVGGSPGFGDNSNAPEDGAIVINEVMSNPPGGSFDWIELYNTTDSPIDIGGWFLSDNDNGEPNITKYEIASGTVLGPNEYIVFSQDQNFGNYSDPGCNLPFGLSSSGESVYLYSGCEGELTGYSQQQDFGPSEYGVSFGRYQKSTGEFDFVAMNAATSGFENSYPKIGPVIINEIMYNPGQDQGLEYIELHNIGSSTVNLYNFMVGRPWRISEAVEYQFSSDASIPAGGYIFIAKDCEKFSNQYPTVPVSMIFGPYSGELSNEGEKINLEMPADRDNYTNIDGVCYDNELPWPVWDQVPGHLHPDGGGASIRRFYTNTYGNDPNSWITAEPSPAQIGD